MISSWTATATNTGFESRMRKPACFTAGGFFQKVGAVDSRKGRLISIAHRNKDEWSGLADLLANLIEKYASVLDIDNLPEPMYSLNDEEAVNNLEYSENGVENTKMR